MLSLETVAVAGNVILYGFTDPQPAFAGQLLINVFYFPSVFLYLAVLGHFRTPLARPFAGSVGRFSVVVLAVGVAVLNLAWPGAFLQGVFPLPGANWEAITGPAWTVQLLGAMLVLGYAFVVTLSAWSNAEPRSVARRRARLFAIGFGLRDGLYLFALGYFALYDPATAQYNVLVNSLIPGGMVALAVMLGYGVLKHQLLDIDLKIKRGINRGTLAGIFLGVFFIVSVVAENYLTTRYGWAIGGVGAGLLLFALAPLQRLADRVADVAMPNVRDDDDYRTVRKREVYSATLESVLSDGEVTDKERSALATLADQLGLSSREALDLERTIKESVAHAVYSDPRGGT